MYKIKNLSMSLFDVILLIIIGGFGLFGLWFGFFHTLGSLVGTVIGAYLSSRYYEPMGEWLVGVTGWNENVSKVLMFIVAFFVINRLVGFVFWLFNKVFKVIAHLPFLKSINRLLGMMLGLFEGALTLGLIIFFIERYPISERLMEQLANSVVAPWLSDLANILIPLLPSALQLLRSSVDYVENVVR